jgi:hypothetical protein
MSGSGWGQIIGFLLGVIHEDNLGGQGSAPDALVPLLLGNRDKAPMATPWVEMGDRDRPTHNLGKL